MPKIQNVSILVIDRETEFLNNIKILLKMYGRTGIFKIQSIGETGSFSRGLSLLEQYKPKLVLLGLELKQKKDDPGLDILKNAKNFSKIIVLSKRQEGDFIFQVMKSGASGYIYKQNAANQLYDAITTVLNLGVYFPPEVAGSFFTYFNNMYSNYESKSNWQPTKVNKSLHFTLREKEVLRYLIEGASNKKIAQKLCITVATVKAHLTSIFNKLEVTNRSQAIITTLKYNIKLY